MGDDGNRGASQRYPTGPVNALTGEFTMTSNRVPAYRACRGILALSGILLTAPALAAPGPCPTPLAKINPESLVLPAFLSTAGGGWAANEVTVNGQPSQPNANQGGLFQWSFVGPPVGTLVNANTAQVQLKPFDVTTS